MGHPWPQGESPRGEGRPTSLVQAQYRVPGLQAHKYRPVPGRALPPLATKMSYKPVPEHPATSPGTSKYPHPREGQLWEHIISTLINVLLSSHTLLTRSSYKPLNTLIPQYLSDLLQPYTQSWMLRSSATGLLSVPRTSLHTFGYRVVRLEATTLCNSSISASQRSVTGILQKNFSNSRLHQNLLLLCKAFLGLLKGAKLSYYYYYYYKAHLSDFWIHVEFTKSIEPRAGR